MTTVASSLQPSREPSRASSIANEEPEDDQRAKTCLWQDCVRNFTELDALTSHLNEEHIGIRKSSYSCEWSGCPRRGILQASRSALMSHLRAHTGERPYICAEPGCDASFTRQNARSKHMRQQHNREASPGSRGRNRKRKRGEDASRDDTPASKLEGSTTTEADAGAGLVTEEAQNLTAPARRHPLSRTPSPMPPQPYSQEAPDNAVNGTREAEDIPDHLLQYQEPVSGRILGRSPAFVRYILMKAKYQYALEQNEHLIEELRVLRNEERFAQEQKDHALDEVITTHLGPQADFLLQGAPLLPSEAHTAVSNGAA